MKKLFVMSDVHGFYHLMQKTLKKNKFDVSNPNHVLVICGDLFDRGEASDACLDFVMSLPEERRILITGNHEDLLSDLFRKRWPDTYDFRNGTVKTVEQISGYHSTAVDYRHFDDIWPIAIQDAWKDQTLKQYYLDLVNYAEIGDYVFIHGWIPYDWNGDGDSFDWRNASLRDWQDARWTNGISAWDSGMKIEGKTVVCGHWHTSWGHAKLHHKGLEFNKPEETKDEIYDSSGDYTAHFEPFIDDGIIALDACTAYSGQMNCITIRIPEKEWRERSFG